MTSALPTTQGHVFILCVLCGRKRSIFASTILCLAALFPADAQTTDDALTRARTITTSAGAYSLVAVPLPDLSAIEEAVQRELHAARERLAALVTADDLEAQALAGAFGELGALYQAHHIYIPAEPCYKNAQTLAPRQFRWPYLAGYLAEQTSQPHKAVQSLERVLSLKRDHEPARLRLALAYLELNQGEHAKPLLERPFETPGLEGAVLFAQGKLALSEREFDDAVRLLERALKAQPHASQIHYPLAMAYRGLRDVERAKSHLAKYGAGEPVIPDPLVDEFSALLSGGRVHIHRGLAAMQSGQMQTGQYEVAAKAFAAALSTEPDNVNLRVSFARALYLSGKRGQARQQLSETLKRHPNHALANFLMGILLERQGAYEEATTRYRTALAAEPRHAGAHHFLGNALMREGAYDKAAQHYADAVQQVPKAYTARLMEAMALLRAGASHALVRERLEVAVARYPEQWMFAGALARLLAASPDDKVRDGARALLLADKLYKQFGSPDHAVTLAMAYAELGRFEEALDPQNFAITMAYAAGRMDLLPWLEQTLAGYKNKQACRQPFGDNDPVFQPIAINPIGPFRDYPTDSPY